MIRTLNLKLVKLFILTAISTSYAFSLTVYPDNCGPVDYYHVRVNDRDGHLDSWKKDSNGPFHTIIGMNMEWWKKAPDVNGWPAYCTAAELKKDYEQYNGAVPGTSCSFGITACLKYYYYTGDNNYKDMAIRMGDYIIRQALYPSSCKAYPNFPVPVGATGDTTPDGSGHPSNIAGEVMPDKGAMTGCALLELYKVTGKVMFLNTAVNIANVLADRAVTPGSANSPWPFRANAGTGATIDGKLCGNQSYVCRLYDELLRIGITGKGKYRTTRNMVWNWLKNTVIADTTGKMWQDFFEDHHGDEDNPTQTNAMETARYLLEKKNDADTDWFRLAERCINTTRNHWMLHRLASDGYTTIGEQAMDMSSYNSHTARYGAILAMYYECGADVSNKDDAYHSLCYGVYSVEDDGYTNTYYKNGRFSWTSDSFGDFILHYMDAFASVPEWAGSTSNHLLRSGSTIKDINYSSQNVTYSVFDPSGTEKLKLTSAPKSVTVNGKPISSYTWDKLTNVLIISRTNGKNVIITI
jgi:hypothetical protein